MAEEPRPVWDTCKLCGEYNIHRDMASEICSPCARERVEEAFLIGRQWAPEFERIRKKRLEE